MKDASSAAITKSHASARLAPAPAATPLTAQTTGTSSARIARATGFQVASRWEPKSPEREAPLMSWPAQKPRPAPVR